MNNPEILPHIRRGGSAFVGNGLTGTRPINTWRDRDNLKVVPLTQWCRENFISKRIGRALIKKKLLLGFRRHHIWWVAANPDCLEQLLECLGIEKLLFDADNSNY